MFLFKKKDYKLKSGRNSSIDVEEVLFEENLKKNDLENRLEVPVSERGIFYFFILFWSVLGIFLLRSFYLGVVKSSYYKKLAEANIYRQVYLLPKRGTIYDRYNKILAEDIPSFRAVILKREFPKSLSEKEKIFERLNKILSLREGDKQRILEELKEKKAYYLLLKDNLSQEEASALMAANLEGVYVLSSFKRFYPDPEPTSGFLGYLGYVSKEDLDKHPEYLRDEMIGKSGIERFYQEFLRGKPGKSLVLRKNDNREKKIMELEKPVPGRDVVLTVDKEFQDFLYQKMKEHFMSLGIKKGLAVALDPNNGDILAFVNYPGYDNNVFITGDSEKIEKVINSPFRFLFNKIIKGLYPIGSTIKPFLALKALEERIISPSTVIDDRPGYIKVGSPYQKDIYFIFRDWKVHGIVDVKKAIAVSCDIFFYYIGGGYKNFRGLGVKKIDEVLKDFRFDRKTNIDLIGEKSGLIPTPEWKKKKVGVKWFLGDTYNLSIGQGYLLVTPIELVSAYAALANGGKFYKPHFLKGANKLLGKVDFSEKNWKVVWEGMRDTVERPYGTGYYLSSLPFGVAGKSGTAQVDNGKAVNSLFVAVAPSDDPKIVLLVMAERAKEHHLNVLPIVKEALLWYYNKRLK